MIDSFPVPVGTRPNPGKPLPHGLVSLSDMLRFNAPAFHNALTSLKHAEAIVAYTLDPVGTAISPDEEISAEAAALTKKLLQSLQISLLVMDAKVTCAALDRLLVPLLKDKYPTYRLLKTRLAEIDSRLYDELSWVHLFVLERKQGELYEPIDPLFGNEVEAKFLSAKSEISEAGKCLAVRRATATVFHLMRCLEVGMHAVRQCLQIPKATHPQQNTWGAILKEIKDHADARKAGTPPWKTATDGRFFEEVHGALQAIRSAWRDPTMHVESTYTEEEAEHLFGLTRGFMQKLASRLDEAGKPLA